MDITTTEEWQSVAALAVGFNGLVLRDLFADAGRTDAMTLQVGDLVVDMSKHRVTSDVLAALVALAERAGLPERVEAMLRGDRINTTEDRAVLHTALRATEDRVVEVDGENVVTDVHDVLRRMTALTDRVRDGD